MNPKIVVTGIQATVKVLRQKKKADHVGIEEALRKIARAVRDKAKYYCPIEYGPLRKSIVTSVTGTGRNAVFNISCGGPEAPYALYVHEDLTKFHEPPTCAKFMTKALLEVKPRMAKFLQEALLSAGETWGRNPLQTVLNKIVDGDSFNL